MTRQSISRKQPRFRYQKIFNGYCYCCFDFGNKAINCVFNFRNIQQRVFRNNQMLKHKVKQSMRKQEHHSIPSPTRRRAHARNINSFELLYNRPKCYTCHNFGHKATEFYLNNYESDSRVDYSVKRQKYRRRKKKTSVG